jgi:pantetheine-phosphate adenylyltransferase
VAVLVNVAKRSLFCRGEHVEMLREVTKSHCNVRIERFHGLLVDFCAANGITAVVRALRAVSDFEYEMQMAQMNYWLAKVETLFMTTNPLYSFLSSSLVKEIAKYGGDVSRTGPRAGCRAGCRAPPCSARGDIPRIPVPPPGLESAIGCAPQRKTGPNAPRLPDDHVRAGRDGCESHPPPVIKMTAAFGDDGGQARARGGGEVPGRQAL